MGGEDGEGDLLVYLTLEDVLEIYAATIDGTPEQARDHLRSREAVEAALARPESYAHYEQADLALQASVLAHGIAESQSFVDGNKRTALVAMLTFLEINGHRVSATDRELADWIISFSPRRHAEERGGRDAATAPGDRLNPPPPNVSRKMSRTAQM